jgi:hypothetical protein
MFFEFSDSVTRIRILGAGTMASLRRETKANYVVHDVVQAETTGESFMWGWRQKCLAPVHRLIKNIFAIISPLITLNSQIVKIILFGKMIQR